MSPLERTILATLAERQYRPVMPQVLAQSLNITKKQKHEFRRTLEKLVIAVAGSRVTAGAHRR